MDVEDKFSSNLQKKSNNPELPNDDFFKIDQLIKSITILKTENERLERLRNLYMISTKHYSIELNSIKEVRGQFKKLLSKEKNEHNQPPFSISINSQTHKKNLQPTHIAISSNALSSESLKISSPNSPPLNLSSDSSSSSPITKTSLHHQIRWDLESSSSQFTKDTVRLRYAIYNTDSLLCSISFNHDGSLLAFADGKSVFIINALNGSPVATIEIPNNSHQNKPHTRSLIFSSDSHWIALSGPSNTIIIIDVTQNKIASILEGHDSVVLALAFMKNSEILLTGGFDGKMIFWDMHTFKQIKIINHDAYGSSTVQLADSSSSENSQHNQGDNDKSEMIIGIAVAHDESFIAVGFTTGMIGLYEPTFTNPMKTIIVHNEYLLGISISPDDKLIATVSQDGTAKLWSTGETIEHIKTFNGHTNYVISSTFSPDGKYLFTGSKDETVRCWDIATGKLLFLLKTHKNTVFQVTHHPTKSIIASCNADGLVCIWDYSS